MKKSQRGFTLLELLLVVGIAAILIIAGITTYSLVSRTNMAGEFSRFINTTLEAVRKSNQGQPTYAAATGYENALATGNMVPAKYINGNQVVTPSRGAVTIVGGGADTFTLTVAVPGRITSEIAQNFDPRNSDELTSLTVCGQAAVTDATALGNELAPATLSVVAACDTDANLDMSIISR